MARPARLGVLVLLALACGSPFAAARPAPAPVSAPTRAAAPTTGCRDKLLLPTPANARRVGKAITCLLNARRRSHGLASLKSNADLRRVAQSYSRLMVRWHFFDHVAPDGTTLDSRVARTRYLDRANSWALGENLAWGTGERSTPLATVRTWMASPYHRPQVLDPHYRDIGVGLTHGAPTPRWSGGATISAVFGGRSMR